MNIFLAEYIGTMLLILIGQGVVCNVVLKDTKGNGGGLISICFAWAIAVFVGVYTATKLGSGGHLNPAVTIAQLVLGNIDTNLALLYISAQFAGAITGAILAWLAYKQHFDVTSSSADKLGVFATGPSIRNYRFNVITEAIGTFVLVFGALMISAPTATLGSLDALPVALLVLGIGLGLGGPTGWAINPARDLGPRIAHFLLPISGKGSSDWSYSWVPVVGPIIGGIVAAVVFKTIQP